MNKFLKVALPALLLAGLSPAAPALDRGYETLREYAPADSVVAVYADGGDWSESRVFDGIPGMAAQPAANSGKTPDGGVLMAATSRGPVAIFSIDGVNTLAGLKEAVTLDGLSFSDATTVAGKPAMRCVLSGGWDAFVEEPVVIEYEKGVFVSGDADFVADYVDAAKSMPAELDGRMSRLTGHPLYGAFNIPQTVGGVEVHQRGVMFCTMPEPELLICNVTVELPDAASAKRSAADLRRSVMVLAAVLSQAEPELGSRLVKAFEARADGSEAKFVLRLDRDLVAGVAAAVSEAQQNESDKDGE